MSSVTGLLKDRVHRAGFSAGALIGGLKIEVGSVKELMEIGG